VKTDQLLAKARKLLGKIPVDALAPLRLPFEEFRTLLSKEGAWLNATGQGLVATLESAIPEQKDLPVPLTVVAQQIVLEAFNEGLPGWVRPSKVSGLLIPRRAPEKIRAASDGRIVGYIKQHLLKLGEKYGLPKVQEVLATMLAKPAVTEGVSVPPPPPPLPVGV
jgi:hypothetical protein